PTIENAKARRQRRTRRNRKHGNGNERFPSSFFATFAPFAPSRSQSSEFLRGTLWAIRVLNSRRTERPSLPRDPISPGGARRHPAGRPVRLRPASGDGAARVG